MEDMFSQYEQRQAQAPQQPPRPIPQTALALKEPSRTRQLVLTALMLVLLSGIGVLGWYAMEESKTPKNVADLPVIEANPQPYKEKPVEPGGMEIPDKDRMVFNTISSSAGNKQDIIDVGMAELTPPPEQPATPEQVAEATGASQAEAAAEPAAGEDAVEIIPEPMAEAPAEPAAEEAAASAAEVTAGKSVSSMGIPPAPPEAVEAAAEAADKGEAPAISKEAGIAEEPASAASADTTEAAETLKETVTAPAVPMKKPALKIIRLANREVPATAAKTAAKASASGSYRIQLGAFKSEKSLEAGWRSLQKKFPSELGKLHRAIEVANLGDKGTFYRLHAGSFDSSSTAQNICSKLKARDQGCIVAK